MVMVRVLSADRDGWFLHLRKFDETASYGKLTYLNLIMTSNWIPASSSHSPHLSKVWAIFAPRFVFASIFLFLTMIQSAFREVHHITRNSDSSK